MSSSVERDAWVLRVLDFTVPRQPAPSAGEGALATPPEPFQIFVKSMDDVTLTLRLPNGPATTLGELRGMVEGRTGLSLDEHSLMIGTKPFRAAHAKLAVAEYGLQSNQTLLLQGALKGGFGERAAMADAIMRGIEHGNVLGDIEATDGLSKAKVGFCRNLLNPKKDVGKRFREALFQKLKKDGLLPDGVTSETQLQNWMTANKTFLSATASSRLQAGNCSEYANVAYTSLVSNTRNQTVYRASMTNGYDHGFVITAPTDHGEDIEALYNDPEAMVVDPWWKSTICTFKDFADDHNPYGKPVDLKTNLKIRRRATAKGRPPLSQDFENAMNAVIDKFVESNKQPLAERAQYVAKDIKDTTTKIAEAARRVQDCQRVASEINYSMDDLAYGTEEEKARLPQAEQEYRKALENTAEAERELEKAREGLRRVFGSSGDIWNRTEIEDVRERKDVFRTLDQAFQLGGIEQLEAEMEHVTDEEEFFEYLARDKQTTQRVLSSDKLGHRFQQHCDVLEDQEFLKLCIEMDLGDLSKYIFGEQKLMDRYFGLLQKDNPFEITEDDIFKSPFEDNISDEEPV